MINLGWRLITSSDGRPFDAVFGEQAPEGGGLEDPEPDIEPTATMMMLSMNGIRQPHTRNWSPEIAAEHEHREIRQQQSGRAPNCGHDGNETTVGVRSRPFHRQQHRAAPFAADADALDEAKDGQENGAPDADTGIGRNEAHRKGCKAGHQQRRDQCPLAPDAVAVSDRKSPRRSGG